MARWGGVRGFVPYSPPTGRRLCLSIRVCPGAMHSLRLKELRAAVWGWTTLKPRPKPQGIRQAQVQEARWNLCSQNMTKWRTAGADCCFYFYFIFLFLNSGFFCNTHEKDFLRSYQKRRETSVDYFQVTQLFEETFLLGSSQNILLILPFSPTFKGWNLNDITIWNMGLLISDLDHGNRQLCFCAQLWVILISMSHLLSLLFVIST